MYNPFRSEAEAYRFVLFTVAYFAAIVAAAAVNRWLGVAVFAALTLVALYWFFKSRPKPPLRADVRPHGAEDERRILVVANETVGGGTLRERIMERSAGVREHVLVVTPALNSPIRHWASDEDQARADAQKRLEESLARLAAAGVDARGEVGDGDPVQAMEDAARTFHPDEIIISTHPPGKSNWLERGVVERARERFVDIPITHVVTDLEAERREVTGS
jgi:hypothetical protein